jgi:hypothetical protein
MSILGHLHSHGANSRVPGPVKHPAGMLTLDEIREVKRSAGAYKIEFRGHVPRHHTVRLFLGDSTRYWMDITGGYHKHKMAHLAQLLELMDKGDLWGKKALVRVAVCSGGSILEETLSSPRRIQCPLEPLEKIGVQEIGSVDGLRYTGKDDGSGCAAYLSGPIGGRYYFSYDGMLLSDSKSRGFDCTTYVGSALGLPNGAGQNGTGETLANALQAQSCEMEHKHAAAIEKFFAEHQTGSYIMWYLAGNKGHVVVVKDCIVHEFTKRGDVDGYDNNEITAWLEIGTHKHQRWSVRRLPS